MLIFCFNLIQWRTKEHHVFCWLAFLGGNIEIRHQLVDVRVCLLLHHQKKESIH